MEWQISDEQCEQNLYYIGCGNFSKPHIVFLGNEEGLGDQSIEANVEARCRTCGKDENGQYIYCIDEENKDFHKGYYEPSGKSLDRKILKYLEDKNQKKNPNENAKTASFLRSLARICLAIEKPSGDKEYWFRNINMDVTVKAQIDHYVRNSLFGSNEGNGLQSALMDWRHLPRYDQKNKYDEYYEYKDKIINNEYIDAFNFKKRKKITETFKKYQYYAKKRLSVYREVFQRGNIPVLVTLGEIEQKEILLKNIYPNLFFEPVYFNSLNRTCGKYGKVETLKGVMHVYLMPHPGSHEFKKGELLGFLQELTYEHLISKVKL